MSPAIRTVVYIFVALTLAIFGNWLRSQTASIAPGAPLFPFLPQYKLFGYQLSYTDLGFVRRGLLGTIYGFDRASPASPAILIAAALPLIAFVVIWATVIARIADQRLALALLVSPAIFVQAGYDLGRFDQMNYVLMALAVLTPWRPAILLLPLTILIHEAAVIIVVPIALALHVWRWGLTSWAILTTMLTLAVTVAIFKLGAQYDQVTLLADYPFAAETSVRILSRNFWDNIDFVTRRIHELGPFDWTALALVGGYLGLLTATAFRVIPVVIVAAAITPLGLSFIGIDFSRWMALSATNLAFALAVLPNHRAITKSWTLTLGVAVVFGPLGVWAALPLWHWILGS
ncbi:MAG: hypothetical protein ACU0CA_04205 [Paracoccaceae bacterium]